ncbi:Uncharacterised protein, partial [Aduncisulcus paluster]
CGKLCQHSQGLLVATGSTEQVREFLDLSVLEQSDGLGARTTGVLLLIGAIPIVSIPVLAVLERIGGQVELLCAPMLEGTKFRQVSQHVRVGGSLGDLPVVRGVPAQGRDRPRS